MSGTFWPTRAAQVVATGLAAARIGTADTSVLSFAAVGTLSGDGAARKFAVTETAANGQLVTCTQKGVYQAELFANVPANGGATLGISFNASAAALLSANDPLNSLATIVAGLTATSPAATALPVTLSATIHVTAVNVTAGTNLIRFHGTATGAGDLAAADITAATVRYRVTYLGDLKGV